MKQFLYKMFVLTAVLSLIITLVWHWHRVFESQPPWLEQTLMIMIDPALPVAKSLRDSVVGRQRPNQ